MKFMHLWQFIETCCVITISTTYCTSNCKHSEKALHHGIPSMNNEETVEMIVMLMRKSTVARRGEGNFPIVDYIKSARKQNR